MTIIGRENKVFESTFHEYSQKEDDLLQKLYGKKNEEFYLLKLLVSSFKSHGLKADSEN